MWCTPHSDNDEEFERLLMMKCLYVCCCKQKSAVRG